MSVYGLEPARFLSKDARIVRGIKQVVPFPSPAAGADLTISVPGGEQWFVMGGNMTFTTSAAVANRLPNLNVLVEGLQVYGVQTAAGVAASTHVNFAPIMCDSPVPVAQGGFAGQFQMPLMPLPQGAQLQTQTFNIDVADQWSNVRLYVARVYLPDQKLDEIAECERDEYFQAMRKAGLTIGA